MTDRKVMYKPLSGKSPLPKEIFFRDSVKINDYIYNQGIPDGWQAVRGFCFEQDFYKALQFVPQISKAGLDLDLQVSI